MSEELQKNYEIFEINREDCKYLVLKRFCHSIEQQDDAVVQELNQLGYKGWVLFDQLFKGGNTSRRYGKQMFNQTFTGPMLRQTVLLNDPVRQMVSQYLKDNNFVVGTVLTDEEIAVIMNGGTI